MKSFFTLIITCFLFSTLSAQDTLLWQNFENDILNMLVFPELDSIGTNNWINWDSDEIPDANARPQNWDFYQDFYIASLDSIPPTDTNFVFGSSSWLQNFEPGNRNYLVTPPLVIGDDQAMLHFKSASFQAPRYMDGYSVLVSTVDYFPESFTDTIFRHKQMIEPLPNGASNNAVNALNIDSFFFAPNTYQDYEGNTQDGYIHDNSLTGTYTSQDTADTFYRMLLEPHSFSLAKYEGETIYIAFLHDSDDDNLVSIDDILVTGNIVMTSNEAVEWDVRYALYPNPATHIVNLSYRFEEQYDQVSIHIYDVQGKLVRSWNGLSNAIGEHQKVLDVRDLIDGNYRLVLEADGHSMAKNFVKK